MCLRTDRRGKGCVKVVSFSPALTNTWYLPICDQHRKKILDLETKLKVAVQDKTSAVQERSKLEAQVKQLVSQKQLHEKSHGKQQNIEEKKRESIMVNFNKNREVLSCTEEKLKTATVELQKMHMDLTAKRSECQVGVCVFDVV